MSRTKIVFTGQLLQVGDVFDGELGDTAGIELSVDGSSEPVLIPVSEEIAKKLGESLYERVSVTIEVIS